MTSIRTALLMPVLFIGFVGSIGQDTKTSDRLVIDEKLSKLHAREKLKKGFCDQTSLLHGIRGLMYRLSERLEGLLFQKHIACVQKTT
jgi:hypothetical protein